MMKSTKRYVLDFETNSQPNHPRNFVYLGEKLEIKPPFQNFQLGVNIKSLFKNIVGDELGYFHNLSFDGWGLIEPLVKNFIPLQPEEKLIKNSFKIFMNEFKSIYCIKIKINHAIITILDSYKILQTSVANLGSKLSFDYSAYRQYQTVGEVPDDVKQYIHADCVVVAKYLTKIDHQFGTSGGMAINSLKTSMTKTDGTNNFELNLTPELQTAGRESYKGGFTNFNPNYQAKKLSQVGGYDINSSYPFAMTHNLPSGAPKIFLKQPPYNPQYRYLLKVFIIKGKVKPSSPCSIIQTKHTRFGQARFFDKIELKLFYVWKQEFAYGCKFYDLKYRILKGYQFKTTKLCKHGINQIYRERLIAKQTNDEVNNHLLKITMNSGYGKLAERPFHLSYVIKLCQNDCKQHFLGGGKYCLFLEQDEKATTRNIFTASYITSYARCRLFKIIGTIKHNFVYCDTDSIYALIKLDHLLTISDELGAGKLEFEGQFKFIKQKCYIKQTKDKPVQVVIAGATMNTKTAIIKILNADWSNFNHGLKIANGNIKIKRTKNAVIMNNYDFQII